MSKGILAGWTLNFKQMHRKWRAPVSRPWWISWKPNSAVGSAPSRGLFRSIGFRHGRAPPSTVQPSNRQWKAANTRYKTEYFWLFASLIAWLMWRDSAPLSADPPFFLSPEIRNCLQSARLELCRLRKLLALDLFDCRSMITKCFVKLAWYKQLAPDDDDKKAAHD